MVEEEEPFPLPSETPAGDSLPAPFEETDTPAKASPPSESAPSAEIGDAAAAPPEIVLGVNPEPPARTEADRRRLPRGPRSELLETREPLWRESGGYRLRLDPPDLARLRELPGSKGKTDRELGETFFDGYAARLTAALEEDVAKPAEVRVVVDPYSRQAFLAVGRTIRGIVSF
jgi:hypothetical protein